MKPCVTGSEVSTLGFGRSRPTSLLERELIAPLRHERNLFFFDFLKNPVAEGSLLSYCKPFYYFVFKTWVFGF